MNFFESKETTAKIKKLEKNQDKLTSEGRTLIDAIKQIKAELVEAGKRTPEYEKEAQHSSKKASEFRNRASERLDEVIKIYDAASSTNGEIQFLKSELEILFEELNTKHVSITEESEEIETKRDEIFERIQNIEDKIVLFENLIENHPDFEDEIIDFENVISRIKDSESKSLQLVKSISTRKNELETLYNEILGYTYQEEESGEEKTTTGIKQDLEASLDGLDDSVEEIKLRIDSLEAKATEHFDNFLKVNSEKGTLQISSWEEKYALLNKKIESLLPNALTAGLSSAFSEKKKEEDSSYDKHKKQFGYGIFGMISVSLIPFLISIVTLLGTDSLDVVINRAPKIVLAILPLYVPVLWLSISSSKKMNLSKRLIEEYSHKEVLSKTFEGLSKQIDNLGEDEISNNLRIRLLQDFLQMYSENPGKLISDYNNSDHPVTELLENSTKLENTIMRLNKIPGMNKVVEILERQSQQKLKQASKTIENSLDRVLAIDGEERENNDDSETA